jgi:hypothetical protein
MIDETIPTMIKADSKMEAPRQEDGTHFLRLRSFSIAFETRIAWVGLGDWDKFIEEGLNCSTILNGLMHLKIRGK